MAFIPDDFARTTVALHGEAGRDWLRALPALVAECEARWSLRVGPPFEPLSYNFAATADGAGGRGFRPQTRRPRPGASFGSGGAARVRRARGGAPRRVGRGARRAAAREARAGDAARRALRRGRRGGDLCGRGRHAPSAARAARRARLPDGRRLGPRVRALPRALRRRLRPLPAAALRGGREALRGAPGVVGRARAAARRPAPRQRPRRRARAPWLAVDPKGLVAEPAYEVGALLRNPLPRPLEFQNPVRVTERRIALLSEELGLERERVRGWGLAQAALSLWWGVEDGGELGETGLAVAEVIAAARP